MTTQSQPRGWLITYTRAGEKHTFFCGHNCIDDYRAFDDNAASEAVYTHAQPVAQDLAGLVAALRDGRQIDEDGTDIGVSGQAVFEAAFIAKQGAKPCATT